MGDRAGATLVRAGWHLLGRSGWSSSWRRHGLRPSPGRLRGVKRLLASTAVVGPSEFSPVPSYQRTPESSARASYPRPGYWQVVSRQCG